MPIPERIGRRARVCGALAASVAAALLCPASPSARQAEGEIGAQQLMRDVVWNELQAQERAPTYWRYRETDQENGTTRTYEVSDTQDGTAEILLFVNGQPLPPEQRERQQALLARLLTNPAAARRAAAARHRDGDRERRLLAMLPQAFRFAYDGEAGERIRLTFVPDPSFLPPTREARVFHDMAGDVLIDPREKRLAAIYGRLTSEVKFGWGLLGHLNAGGTFEVQQVNLGDGHWQLSRLRVNMQGVALFFKTIGVQENDRYSDFQPNPPQMTLPEAVTQLDRASDDAASAAASSGEKD